MTRADMYREMLANEREALLRATRSKAQDLRRLADELDRFAGLGDIDALSRESVYMGSSDIDVIRETARVWRLRMEVVDILAKDSTP